jgi:thiol-disulfide isomerase/thioredoxin
MKKEDIKRQKLHIRAGAFTILFLAMISNGYAQKNLWYDFNGTARLEINYTNSTEPTICNISTYKMFPEEYIDIGDTLSPGSGKRIYNIPMSWPRKVTITTNGTSLPILVTPGEHLICNIDLSNIKNVNFGGTDSLALVNEYLVKKQFQTGQSFQDKRRTAFGLATNLTEYGNKMDTLHKQELAFFNKHKMNLPGWFQTYEYWDIAYGNASSRMNSAVYPKFSGESASVSSSFYNFLDSLPINNIAAKNVEPYYLFLYELFNKRLKNKDSSDCALDSFVDYQICQATRELSTDNRDLFTAWYIQLIYNHYKRDVAKEYLAKNTNIFSSEIWTEKLNSYFRSKEIFLAHGKPAPNFVLSDIQDSLISLRSMKDHIVLLSFWFVGCKGCVQEFPFENALAEKFKDKPVKIVNVCINSSEENWRRASERFGLKTINLWVNPQWEKSITEKYDLEVFPKYVLIDQNQNVAISNADRPSQGLENQITELLNN